MKIIFFGSDDFAARHLKALCDSDHKILACVTQPARAKGRHLEVTDTIVKSLALQNKIPVFEPDVLKEEAFVSTLKSFNADLFAVVAYGKKLPLEIINAPKLFCVNVHGSLLPKYRGAAPINWAIINGEKETGVTIFKLSAEFDCGEIISRQSVPIEGDDNAITLRSKVCQAGVELLLKTLITIERKEFTLTRQDQAQVSLAPKLSKELGAIDWKKSAQEIHNLVRGLVPWPGAYTYFDKKMLKVLETQVLDGLKPQNQPGEVVLIDKDGIVVAAGTGQVRIKHVHLEASKAMDAKSFVAGHHLKSGYIFRSENK